MTVLLNTVRSPRFCSTPILVAKKEATELTSRIIRKKDIIHLLLRAWYRYNQNNNAEKQRDRNRDGVPRTENPRNPCFGLLATLNPRHHCPNTDLTKM